jgi:hypothetical protein
MPRCRGNRRALIAARRDALSDGDECRAGLIIACELAPRDRRQRLNAWSDIDVQAAPGSQSPGTHTRRRQRRHRERLARQCARIFVAYADCSTGGRLDAVLRSRASSLAGSALRSCCHRERLLPSSRPTRHALPHGFLARHFERLFIQGSASIATRCGNNRNYTRVVYLDSRGKNSARRSGSHPFGLSTGALPGCGSSRQA